MDTTVVAASSAVLGSMVGGAAMASGAVVAATDQTIKRILQQYFGPNLTKEERRELAFSRIDEDPVRGFSQACREELQRLERRL